jgi:hypothetical protein
MAVIDHPHINAPALPPSSEWVFLFLTLQKTKPLALFFCLSGTRVTN